MTALLLSGLGILSAIEWHDRRQTPSDRDNVRYDAGQVFADITPQINHRFKIINRSNRTVRLSEKQCTCTCTTGRLTPEVLQPGQAAFLDMSIRLPGAYSGRSEVRCELVFDDGSAKTCTLSYESFPRIMADLPYLDLGVVEAPSDRQGGHELGSDRTVQTRASLFAPPSQTLPSLRPIRSPEEIEATVVSEPETSVVGNVQRLQYLLRFRANPSAMLRRSGGAFTSIVNLLSDDGAATTVTLSWRVVERYSGGRGRIAKKVQGAH